VMLMGLKKPLNDGDKFSVWLTFKHAGEVEVEVWVQTPKDANKAEEHKHWFRFQVLVNSVG
jgi:copper(I)-binding protein